MDRSLLLLTAPLLMVFVHADIGAKTTIIDNVQKEAEPAYKKDKGSSPEKGVVAKPSKNDLPSSGLVKEACLEDNLTVKPADKQAVQKSKPKAAEPTVKAVVDNDDDFDDGIRAALVAEEAYPPPPPQQIHSGGFAGEEAMESDPPEDNDRMTALERKVACLCERLENCCTPFRCPDQNIWVEADLLYWKFTEGGTEFAIDNVSPDPSNTGVEIPNGTVRKVHFDWEAGYRIAGGYTFDEQGWDLFLGYSHIEPDGDSNTTSPFIFPLLLFQDSNAIPVLTSASAHWKIKYQNLDFEVGREINFCNSLMLRPFFGIKAAKIDQNFRVAYGNNDPTITQVPVGQSDFVHEKNNFKGIGLRAGFLTAWDMGYGLSLYGAGAFAVLISKVEIEQKQNEFDANLAFLQRADMKSNFHPLLPVADVMLGVAWDRELGCNDQYAIQLHVDFEGQYWWRQNYLEHFVGSPAQVPYLYVRPTEDLGIYGVTVGASFAF